MTIFLGLLFGLLQGLRHAFEPDHVVAVSTMISEERSMRARVVYAASWGVGHAAMLVAVGAILMGLRAELPPRVDAVFEVAVSVMLVLLGGRALAGALRETRERTDEVEHGDGHGHGVRGWRAIGPLAMGMVHGLAGSGALTALVVARLPSLGAGLAFMVLFGAGATLGMSLLAGVAGVPLGKVLQTRWGMPTLLGATGALSLGLGLMWIGPAVMRVAGT